MKYASSRYHRFATCLLFLALMSLTSCTDARAKRAGSLLKIKTQVAKTEFEQAKTDADKVKVAKEWFDTAPRLTDTLDDYLQGRKPVEDVPAPSPVE